MAARINFPQANPAAGSSVALGTTADGEQVAVPFFTAVRGTRTALIGDAALPKLIALRALSAGARLQVLTSQPGEWLRLRSYARLAADRMAVVPPRTPAQADATLAVPWMIIDDTGDVATPAVGPWQAAVSVPGARSVTVAGLRDLDSIILHRSIPAWRGAVVAALRLPDQVVRLLHGIPSDVVAVVSAGVVRLVPLRPDAYERALLRGSGVSSRPGYS